MWMPRIASKVSTTFGMVGRKPGSLCQQEPARPQLVSYEKPEGEASGTAGGRSDFSRTAMMISEAE